MAEKVKRGSKKMVFNPLSLPPETTQSDEEIQAEIDAKCWAAAVQRATRIAYFVKQVFPDIPENSNTDCLQYLQKLFDATGGVSVADESNESVVQEDNRDFLSDAIRSTFPDAPGKNADEETCMTFAGKLLQRHEEDRNRPGLLDNIIRSVFPDMPDISDPDGCREYLENLAQSMERLAWMEKLFKPVLNLAPDAEYGSPEMLGFEEDWSDYVGGEFSRIQQTIVGGVASRKKK